MSKQLIIPTEQPSLHLRELNKPSDDLPFFTLVQRNKDFWAEYAQEVLFDNQYITWVRENRQQAKNEGELRLGIFHEEDIVGWVSVMDYSRDVEVGNWCGVWLDELNTGKGYATASIRSLARHIRASDYPNQWMATTIDQDNIASQAVFERVGFTASRDNPLPYQQNYHVAYRLSPDDPIK